jgi:hypothetical protein
MKHFLIIISIGMISCAENVKDKLNTRKMTLFVYGLDTIQYDRLESKRKIDYSLTLKENDSTKVFRYDDIADSTKLIIVKFRKKEKDLRWGPFYYVTIDSAELTIDNTEPEKFYLYGHQDSVIDENSPFYFNTTVWC